MKYKDRIKLTEEQRLRNQNRKLQKQNRWLFDRLAALGDFFKARQDLQQDDPDYRELPY